MNLFDISNWTNLEKTNEQKHNVLLSLFAILGIITSIIQIAVDFINIIPIGAIVDSLIFLVMIIVYILNEKKKHLFARILFLSFLNIMLFVFACIVPKTNGVYIFYFPIIAVTTLIFDANSGLARNLFIASSIALVILLEASDYQFFGDINIQEGIVDNYSFRVNIFISFIIVVVSIDQMSKINREIDQKLIMIADELKLKNDDLKKSNTELDHFVYSTSHDLKAPLSSISGLINIAKLEVTEEKSLEYFNMIEGRIDKLNMFIKDIIDLSKNSRLESVKEEVDIALLVDNAIENNKYMDNAGSIQFTRNIEKGVIYRLDRARLEIVLNNLISNAIKYHKQSGERGIDISVKNSKRKINIIIKDNGIGINEERQKKVFDMFYRGHDNSEGSGLGLYIVKDVITKMKGNLILTSHEDVGTEININLPIT